LSKDSLVALNLAVEGVEAVRNIRDTNWIKFGYDKENCWDMKPNTTSADSCLSVNNKIANVNYTVDLDPETYKWDLSDKASDTLDLESGTAIVNEKFRLKFIDVTAGDSDGNGNALDDPDIYASDAVWSGHSDPGEDSKFYRMVNITPQGGDTLSVVSLVQWRAGNVVHQIELNSTLTNFNRTKVNP